MKEARVILQLLLMYTFTFLHLSLTGQIIDTVRCKTDPTKSYALYVPAKGVNAALPVIYFFDPHAAGILPVRKYKPLADAYGFILVGSNNSKNGNDWPAAADIWRKLTDDAGQRLKIDARRIYACGFSGGAKVAGYLALHHPEIKGVIAGGAGLPDGTSAGDFNFAFTALAGEGDMNMTELLSITAELDHTRTKHRIIFFEGKHEWAPVNTMGLAFAGLQFDAMRAGLIPKNNFFISSYIANSKKRLRAYSLTKQLIKASTECALSIAFLDGVSNQVAWFRQQAAALAASPDYLIQREGRENLLATEQNTKTGYMQHFQQSDDQYWTSTIHDLQAEAVGHTATEQMNQRLLAYLSLAFYSISNQMINGNQNAAARHFVELYKLADARNSEAWFFSAILDARDGHAQDTENDLLKATANGFTDKSRLLQQAEFKNLLTPESFARIINKIHTP